MARMGGGGGGGVRDPPWAAGAPGPVFVAVPFDELLLEEGVRVSLAMKLFDGGAVSLRQGAKMADMSLSEFMAECSARDVPLVRYPPEDLAQEMAVLDALPDRR
ncbi:MAG: UPF0175 family protein [Sulfuritalea sp.]|nr:UPF0175 family protein [Sulfuritalea sp.]